mmetsp:Transcript_32053/g.77505  ORF Transcript_32053/g.77505 Transcript_32053/m.77505 type:complete len:320 (+) Transcript_32053:145-1104(+)
MNRANSDVSDGIEESWVDVPVPTDDLVFATTDEGGDNDNVSPDDSRPADEDEDDASPGTHCPRPPLAEEHRLPSSEGYIGDVRVTSGDHAEAPWAETATDNADPAVSVRHPTISSALGEDEKNDRGALVEESLGAGDGSGSGRCDDTDASVENDGDDDDDRDMTGERQESRGGDNGVPAGMGTTEGTAADDQQSTEESACACAVDGANEPLQDMEGMNNNSVDPSLRHHSTAYLNAALESMERMRRLNLEVEFSDACPGFPVHHDRCVHCQREALREFLLVAANDDDDPHPAKEDGWGGIRIGGLKLDGSQLRNFENIR